MEPEMNSDLLSVTLSHNLQIEVTLSLPFLPAVSKSSSVAFPKHMVLG